jgi:hypothetical protein
VRILKPMRCKYKIYKTQFLPLLMRILKPMRFKYKIYKTQFLPLLVRILKPMRFNCKIYKTQSLPLPIGGAVRSSQGNLEVKNAHGATPLFPPTIVLRKLIWKANIGGKICASSLHS